MSENKETMKLYTEEQLVNTAEAIRDYLKNYPEKFHESMIEKHLKNLTPIELPSDVEIEDASLEQNNDDLSPAEEFQRGAKWMCNKIQGGNDE
jgi:hypothetical protein